MDQITVTDNYLSHPVAERDRALNAAFSTQEGYGGISTPLVDVLRTQFYRRYMPNEPTPTYIHSDINMGHTSEILYLSWDRHCIGQGLAFWKHKETGLSSPRGVTPELAKQLDRDGLDESKWVLTDYVQCRFNRMVKFPAERFHSRYPKEVRALSMNDCRLIRTTFRK